MFSGGIKRASGMSVLALAEVFLSFTAEKKKSSANRFSVNGKFIIFIHLSP